LCFIIETIETVELNSDDSDEIYRELNTTDATVDPTPEAVYLESYRCDTANKHQPQNIY
jgi:hypothetical protein